MSETSTPPAIVSFVGGLARSERVPLAWPVEFEGRLFETITVRRLTTREVADFVAAVEVDRDAEVRLPMFVDEAGAPIPAPVMDGIDPDDTDKLNEVASRFFPARFRADPSSGPGSATGAASEAT